jgi:Flp pilus assembly protein TadG
MTKGSRVTKHKQRGQSMVEFTFVGIPLIFVLISIFEVSRGMWMYHTMAYAVKVGVRYAIVHGANCDPLKLSLGNNCQVKLGPSSDATSIAGVIRNAGVGLVPTTTLLTFTSLAGATTPCTLDTVTTPCPATVWPPTGSNDISDQITIKITTPFTSGIAMFWPGSRPNSFGSFILGAQSSDRIQY